MTGKDDVDEWCGMTMPRMNDASGFRPSIGSQVNLGNTCFFNSVMQVGRFVTLNIRCS